MCVSVFVHIRTENENLPFSTLTVELTSNFQDGAERGSLIREEIIRMEVKKKDIINNICFFFPLPFPGNWPEIGISLKYLHLPDKTRLTLFTE